MLWFEGSVSEAVVESKRIKSVFIVYIRGDDEETKKMDMVWNDEQIKSVVIKDCTAIKLHVNSVEGKQFASVYPVICIPCTFFLDGNGIPSEVIAGSLSAEQFLEKAKQSIQKHRIKFPNIETELSPSIPTSPSTSTAEPVMPSQQSDEPVAERNDSNPELTERVARAKKLVEEKNMERQEKEKEDVGRKELKRRKEGQQSTKAKIENEEKLAQQMVERVKIEKAKTNAQREAVRQKIAQDKAERAAKEEIERKARRDAALRIDPHINTNNSTVECSDVRLQFRLPDGSSVTENFPRDATLETARQFLCSKINFTKRMTFWTTFPRKHFGDEDFPKTLTELALAPSAALMVDLSSGNSSRGSAGLSIPSAITWLLAPLLALLSFLKFLFLSSPEQPERAMQENSTHATTNTNSSGSSSPTSEVRRRTRESSGKKEENFKKEGKIHSFKQDDNSDDENNTWNGNSTQQM